MTSRIISFLSPRAIAMDIRASNKSSLLRQLSQQAAEPTGLSADYIFAELCKREGLGSTGMGDGVAIPHATYAGLKSTFGIAARVRPAIEFESIDGKPVDLVFVLLTPALSDKTHLNALASISRKLRNRDIVEKLRAAPDGETFYDVLTTDTTST